jgi:hypothetical protein
MGQAKKRGSFEDRREQSIERTRAENAEYKRIREEKRIAAQMAFDALPEEEKILIRQTEEMNRERRSAVTSILPFLLWAGMSGGYGSRNFR